MANVAQKVDFRVYIEGCLIPASGISLTIYDGQRSQGYILTTPSAAAKRIPPMSTVAIFYFDNNYGQWCLFWEGMYTGWQFNKSPMSRSISLQISGWGVMLDKVFAFMSSNNEDLIDSQINVYALGNSSPVQLKPSNSSEEKGIQAIANTALNFFQPRGAMDFNFMAQKIALEKVTDFYDLTRRLTEGLAWLNPLVFYRYCNSKYRYKVAAIADDKFSSFFEFGQIQQMITNFASSYFTGKTSANDFIDVWMAQAYYSKSELVSPPYMTQQIYTPKAFFNVPPACNTLFPEFITNISYAENFMAHPTRLLIKSNPAIFSSTPIHSAHFYNDKMMYENSTDILSRMKGLQQNLFVSDYSEEEYEKYPTPAVDELNNSLYFTLIKDNKSKLEASLGAVTHYMYLERKYGVRPLTISGIFNPYFIVGFPCVVFDEEASFMAKPISVTYNISASGDASTTYMCNFAIPLEKEDLLDSSKFPVLPGWLPTAYSPQNIDATYGQLLGMNNIGTQHSALGGKAIIAKATINVNKQGLIPTKVVDDKMGSQPVKANISVIANSIFGLDRSKASGLYDVSEDKLDFARKYVLRGMTTFSDYQKFYGSQSPTTTPGETVGDSSMLVYSHITSVKNITGCEMFYDKAYQDNPANTTPEGLVNNATGDNIKVEPSKHKLMLEIAKQMREVAQKG